MTYVVCFLVLMSNWIEWAAPNTYVIQSSILTCAGGDAIGVFRFGYPKYVVEKTCTISCVVLQLLIPIKNWNAMAVVSCL